MRRGDRQLAPAAAVAVLLHGAALGGLALMGPGTPLRVKAPPTRVRLVARTPPAPPREEPRPPAPPPAAPVPKAARTEVIRMARAEPAAVPPPLPAPRRFAVSMEATVPGGGVAVPVTDGPTATRGRTDLPESVPVGDNVGLTALEMTDVERAPQLLSQPSPDRLRTLYPDAARREQLEVDVPLQLLVDVQGRVAEVRVVKAAGNGFDEAAAAAAREIRFRPGLRVGKPVAVWIPWTLKFRLDG